MSLEISWGNSFGNWRYWSHLCALPIASLCFRFHSLGFFKILKKIYILGVPVEQDAGWASEMFWAVWRQERTLSPAGIRTPDHLARRLVTTLITVALLPSMN